MAPGRAIFSLLALLRAVGSADAASVCPDTPDRAVPTVVTLFAAPNNVTNAAWVLKPDCSLEVIEIEPAPDNRVPMLNCSSRGIQRVESIPSKAQLLHLEGNPVTDVDLSSGKDLYQLVLAWDNLTSVDTFKFPELLGIIDFDGNNLQGFAKGAIPAKVNTMYLNRNKITSLANFALPTFLTSLHLEKNNFTTFDFAIPAGLVDLHMDSNTQLKTIENVTMPNTLTTFTCTDCAIETFRGVQLSVNLEKLDLKGSTLTEFELRQSDLSILSKKVTFSGAVAQTKCSHPNATLNRATGVSVCVISDAAFDEKYLGLSQSSGSTTAGGSSSTVSLPSNLAPSPSTSPSPGSSPTPSPPASASISSSSSSPSTTTVIIIVAVVGVVCAIIAFFLYRKCSRKHHLGKALNGDEYQDASTVEAAATAESGSANPSAASEYLTNDIRNDEALIAYRIAYEDIQILRVIGKGGFGVVHLGKFRGRKVAVKQMLPDKAKDMRVVRSFMDEIRLCASLEHPRIVAFIGLRWSTLQDVAVVNEYMAGGDLHSVLRKQQICDPADWFEASAALRPKSAVALDVVVALVYLHSFEQPIIHRDLKTRNVLLTSRGDAKLSDFGTSREALLDETMTGEIGTLPWIAPEVLRGDRYNEKVDIYSLGVLLVELDTASHPYQNARLTQNGSPISNTRIAMMVSAGKLVPSTSRGCPSDIAALIRSCLTFDPSDRPSAMAIHHELRKIFKARSTQRMTP